MILAKSYNTRFPHLWGIASHFTHDLNEQMTIVACLPGRDLLQKGVDRLLGGLGLLLGHDFSLIQFNKKKFLLQGETSCQ